MLYNIVVYIIICDKSDISPKTCQTVNKLVLQVLYNIQIHIQ